MHKQFYNGINLILDYLLLNPTHVVNARKGILVVKLCSNTLHEHTWKSIMKRKSNSIGKQIIYQLYSYITLVLLYTKSCSSVILL